jgi:hypothetical protein
MQMKIMFAALAALAMLTIPAGARDLALPSGNDAPDVDLCLTHDAHEIAEANGVATETFPTATPGLTVTVHMLCYMDTVEDVLAATDCTATSYSLTGWKWNTAYSGVLDPTNPYGLSASGLLSAFNAGGNAWDNVVSADIFGSISQGGSASKVRTYDGVNQHGFKAGGNFVAATYTWASGGIALESDAAYNTNYGWSLSGAAGKMDVQNVQTHEIGHTFGMGHTTTASANACLTMYPYVNYGQTNLRTLGDGDISGIDALY